MGGLNLFWASYRREKLARSEALRSLESLQEQCRGLSDAQLREKTNEPGDGVLQPMAVIAEAVRRVHGLVAYEVQLLAGLTLAQGGIAEMATGEGKTLVALLPAFVFALRGRGAHVATVNAYLAKRDCEFARAAFALLGRTVGLLEEGDSKALKRQAYGCDVTYGVGTEFGFDYLRDQIAIRALRQQRGGREQRLFHEVLLNRPVPQADTVQRGLAYAVIDEADSVLIDEANSPLIISSGARSPSETPEVYRHAHQVASQLSSQHFERVGQRLCLTEAGLSFVATQIPPHILCQLRRIWPHYVELALHAKERLRKDIHYVVSEDRVVIVDEFTGRLCPDRTWRDGLHQAVEAACGVTITRENLSDATITRPAYFRLYEMVCGMSGTALESARELLSSYSLKTHEIPLHLPSKRTLLPDRIFRLRSQKLAATVQEIQSRHASGQPLLIGTRTIENSEALAQVLAPLNLPFELLNAKQDAEEARIIENAGRFGAITIATNMAGRGAHIPVPEQSLAVGGLHVIGLERHESSRIDRQLVGRAARQGQPGSAQFFLSLEDDLLLEHAPALAANLSAEFAHDSELPAHVGAYFLKTQKKVEATDRHSRERLARFNEVLNELKQEL